MGIKSAQHVITDSVPVVLSCMGKGMYQPCALKCTNYVYFHVTGLYRLDVHLNCTCTV